MSKPQPLLETDVFLWVLQEFWSYFLSPFAMSQGRDQPVSQILEPKNWGVWAHSPGSGLSRAREGSQEWPRRVQLLDVLSC